MTPLLVDDAAMLTDLYQLTMMQGYWAHDRLRDRAAFELFFRNVPEGGGYCIASGIEDALANVLAARFTEAHLDYLKSLELFRPEFLAFLRTFRFTGSIRAVAEGTAVFPHEPIVEVGPYTSSRARPTITGDTAIGRSISLSRIDLPGNSWRTSRNDVSRPKIVLQTTANSATSTVTRNAWVAAGVVIASQKEPNPLWKARKNTRPTGTTNMGRAGPTCRMGRSPISRVTGSG